MWAAPQTLSYIVGVSRFASLSVNRPSELREPASIVKFPQGLSGCRTKSSVCTGRSFCDRTRACARAGYTFFVGSRANSQKGGKRETAARSIRPEWRAVIVDYSDQHIGQVIDPAGSTVIAQDNIQVSSTLSLHIHTHEFSRSYTRSRKADAVLGGKRLLSCVHTCNILYTWWRLR